MSDNKDMILSLLQELNLTADEAKVYLELLREPATHLRLSTVTGINRTKVYRLIDNLEKRSLVARRADDRGVFLVATDPATLEVELTAQEEKVERQRQVLSQLLPSLGALQLHDASAFVVRTYEGIEGLKQMCWHELKTKGESLSLGGQTIEDLIENRYWAAKHRKLTVEAGYSIREIINGDVDAPTWTANEAFMKRYQVRRVPSEAIYFDDQTVIYNDTVALYHWRKGEQIGVEIVAPSYATMMRAVFERYWQLASTIEE